MTKVLHASTDRHNQWGGPKRWIRIFIHDTNEELQKAAAKYSDDPETAWSDVAGCFQPTSHRERWNKETKEWEPTNDPHFAGVMRLSRKQLDPETVVHECVHAGIAIYRMDVSNGVFLGEDCGDNEEHMAYIIGDISGSVSTALHKAGVWK